MPSVTAATDGGRIYPKNEGGTRRAGARPTGTGRQADIEPHGRAKVSEPEFGGQRRRRSGCLPSTGRTRRPRPPAQSASAAGASVNGRRGSAEMRPRMIF